MYNFSDGKPISRLLASFLLNPDSEEVFNLFFLNKYVPDNEEKISADFRTLLRMASDSLAGLPITYLN